MASRDPELLCVTLQVFWRKLQAWYQAKFPDRELFLTCTYRSPEEQRALYKQNRPGKILTRCDGVKVRSKHNFSPAHAFDVAVRFKGNKGRVEWQEVFYIPLGRAIAELGYEGRIRWGGWFSFRDYPHFEVLWPKNEESYTKLTGS
jgi:hypothetical protein